MSNNQPKSGFSLWGSFFKNKKENPRENKTLTNENMQKEEVIQPLKETPPPPVKSEQEVLPDKLVSNLLSGTTTGLWEYPSPAILKEYPFKQRSQEEFEKIAAIIEQTALVFGIDSRVAEANILPFYDQFVVELSLNADKQKYIALKDEFAYTLELKDYQLQVQSLDEVNKVAVNIIKNDPVLPSLRLMLTSDSLQHERSKTAFVLGLNETGIPIIETLENINNLLVIGDTESRINNFLHTTILSLLFRASPQEVRLILIDPNRFGLSEYNGIPHLLTPVVTETFKILSALKWVKYETDKRYKLFSERGVQNIGEYNEKAGFQALPYIVVIIKDFSDLLMYASVEIEDIIAQITQLGNRAGVYTIISNQKSKSDQIAKIVKSNIQYRINLTFSSKISSENINDSYTMDFGDLLYFKPDQTKPIRIQPSFVTLNEIKKVVEYLRSQNYPVEYTEEVTNRPLPLKKGGTVGTNSDGKDGEIEEAIRLVCQFNTASASFLQRKMSIGYTKAARILDQLEEMGIVGAAEGAAPRDVLVRNAEEFLANQKV